MSPVLHLIARVVESESRLHSPRDGVRPDHDVGHKGGLKWWGILLVVYLSILSLVYICSFVYYWRHEIERRSNIRPFSVGKIALKALSVATGVHVWVWVFRKRGWCGANRKNRGSTAAGPYTQFDSWRTHASMGSRPVTANSMGSYTSRPSTPARYGASVKHSISYTSYGSSKSLGYKTAHDGFSQQSFIPMSTRSSHLVPPPYMSSELPAELPVSSPLPVELHVSSPLPVELHVSSPPPAELHGDDIQPHLFNRTS